MNLPRMSTQTLRVLQEFVAQPKTWRYGYDLSRDTELKAGTLYPSLMRLCECGILESKWSEPEGSAPPRHMYRLTAPGLRAVKEALRERGIAFREPLASGGRA